MWKAPVSPTPTLAIEAIFENAEAKKIAVRHHRAAIRSNEILASNTSSIPLDELRKGLKAPQRFLGLHFFNPVAQMPLIEVVRHDQLDPAIEKRALAFCKAIGKLPVAVKGTPGFLVNRILMPYLLEALRLYNEGVPGPCWTSRPRSSACRWALSNLPIRLDWMFALR